MKLRFCGVESVNAIIRLQVRGLCEVSGEFCPDINDATLSVKQFGMRYLRVYSLGLMLVIRSPVML